jgi:hypothetical protein
VSVRKSLFLSFAQRNGTLLIQFMSSLLIARLLTPHEIGIFSIGSVIVAFSHVVRDFGVANYIVQKKTSPAIGCAAPRPSSGSPACRSPPCWPCSPTGPGGSTPSPA